MLAISTARSRVSEILELSFKSFFLLVVLQSRRVCQGLSLKFLDTKTALCHSKLMTLRLQECLSIEGGPPANVRIQLRSYDLFVLVTLTLT